MVATPYASGLAALVDDELEMGAACIDMGGGTTTISVFADGKFVYADAIPVGGNHVTMDLARGLSTRLENAERLKVMHGSASARQRRRPRRGQRPADRRRRHATCRSRCRARRWRASSAPASMRRWR